jgi:MFS family permease
VKLISKKKNIKKIAIDTFSILSSLICGCTLLIAGSMADIIGRLITSLVGCGLYSAFTLDCGLSKTGATMIIFRGFQGILISLCLTTDVVRMNKSRMLDFIVL